MHCLNQHCMHRVSHLWHNSGHICPNHIIKHSEQKEKCASEIHCTAAWPSWVHQVQQLAKASAYIAIICICCWVVSAPRSSTKPEALMCVLLQDTCTLLSMQKATAACYTFGPVASWATQSAAVSWQQQTIVQKCLESSKLQCSSVLTAPNFSAAVPWQRYTLVQQCLESIPLPSTFLIQRLSPSRRSKPVMSGMNTKVHSTPASPQKAEMKNLPWSEVNANTTPATKAPACIHTLCDERQVLFMFIYKV